MINVKWWARLSAWVRGLWRLCPDSRVHVIYYSQIYATRKDFKAFARVTSNLSSTTNANCDSHVLGQYSAGTRRAPELRGHINKSGWWRYDVSLVENLGQLITGTKIWKGAVVVGWAHIILCTGYLLVNIASFQQSLIIFWSCGLLTSWGFPFLRSSPPWTAFWTATKHLPSRKQTTLACTQRLAKNMAANTLLVHFRLIPRMSNGTPLLEASVISVHAADLPTAIGPRIHASGGYWWYVITESYEGWCLVLNCRQVLWKGWLYPVFFSRISTIRHHGGPTSVLWMRTLQWKVEDTD